MSTPTATPSQIGWRPLVAIVFGTVLSPVNSSIIAVALVSIRDDFNVGVIALSWLISSFYLVSAVGQSVLGRLADQLGPRRLQCAGYVLVVAGGILGPLAPTFGWLTAARLLIGLGTAAGFPAGLALLRNAAGGDAPPPSTLAAVTIAASSSAAVGPAVGGVLVALAGWPAIFYVNVAVGLAGLALSLRWLPRDPQHAAGIDLRLVRRVVDLPGIVAFSVALASVLALLLSLAEQPLWWLAAPAAAGVVMLAVNDRRREDPFLDVRMLAANRPLLAVCVQYLLVNLVAFSVYLSLPLWLEAGRGLGTSLTGVMVAPLAAVAIFAAPLAARIVARHGVRPSLLAGSGAMVTGSLLLLTLTDDAPLWAILPVVLVLGIPIAFNNLGLQSALYAVSDPERTGAAAGIFQTSRFIGAVLATSLMGVVFADSVDERNLHQLALLLVTVAVTLVALSLRRPPRPPR